MQSILGKIRCIMSIVKLPYHQFFRILLINCCFIWSIHSWRWGGRGGSGRWLFYPRCQIKRGRTWCRWTMLNNQTTKQNPSVYYAFYKKPASRSLWKLQVNEIHFRFKIKRNTIQNKIQVRLCPRTSSLPALLSLGKKKKETTASQVTLSTALISLEVNQCQLLTGSSVLVFLVAIFCCFLCRANKDNKSIT